MTYDSTTDPALKTFALGVEKLQTDYAALRTTNNVEGLTDLAVRARKARDVAKKRVHERLAPIRNAWAPIVRALDEIVITAKRIVAEDAERRVLERERAERTAKYAAERERDLATAAFETGSTLLQIEQMTATRQAAEAAQSVGAVTPGSKDRLAIVGSEGAMSVRVEWAFEIEDITAVPTNFTKVVIDEDAVNTFLKTCAGRPTITGLRIYPKAEVVLRERRT